MKEFECSKCGSKDVFISKSGNNTGLYCGDCGKWITWLNKDQIRLIERQIANNREKADEVRAACATLGVQIIDSKGNYRSLIDVLSDIRSVTNS